jgi:quercetin dioxygenase-like cupin family protein
MSAATTITPWDRPTPPTEADIHARYNAEDLQPYAWSNKPGDKYIAHTHAFHKVLYVVRGSITFGLPDTGESFTLHPGDRLDLPAGVRHNATVGPEGVLCLEGHRL